MDTLGTLKAIAAGLLGVALGALAVILYAYFITLPAARDEGARTERGIWRESERVATEKREADRIATQADIAQIERGYLERDATRSAQMAGLEAELAKREAEDAQNPPAAGGACRPAVPRSLRDRLDPIGRRAAAAGDNTAVSSPAMR